MNRKGLTPLELSAKSGVNPPTLNRYINDGRKRPSATHLEKVAAALGVSTSQLLGPTADLAAELGIARLTHQSALDRAAENFSWSVPTATIRVVMERARAEAATSDQPEWFWGLRLKELVDEAQTETETDGTAVLAKTSRS